MVVVEALIASYEVDAMRVRAKELEGIVDHRVICEATTTFNGSHPVPQRYTSDETTTVIRIDLPSGLAPMGREAWLRYQSLQHAQRLFPHPENWFIVADGDEIPHPKAIEQVVQGNTPAVLHTDYREWYMNWRVSVGVEQLLHQPVIGKSRHFAVTGSAHEARRNRMMGSPVIGESGWHLSTLGDASLAAKKLSSFSHTEYATPEFTDLDVLGHRRANKRDLLDRFDLEVTTDLPACADLFPELLHG